MTASSTSFDGFDPMNHTGPFPSPCTGICQINTQTGLCKGCQRTIDEIIDWGVASESKKQLIWLAILARRAAR
jgi:predicted Fe-S protein YdhL (DUF1289 family)